MKRWIEKVLSLIITICMIIPIFSFVDIGVFAASDITTLYQYQSVGGGAGPCYDGSITVTKLSGSSNTVYGRFDFINCSCLLQPNPIAVSDRYEALSKGGNVFDKKKIYFFYKTKSIKNNTGTIMLGSVNGKGDELKYTYFGKVYFDGKGTKINNIKK